MSTNEKVAMERTEVVRRLYIGGLFPEVTAVDLQGRFSNFGAIDNVEVKIKKGLEGDPVKVFAYLDIKAPEGDIKKCIKLFGNTKWKGSELKIEIAKENFLARLDKEINQPEETNIAEEEHPQPIKPHERIVKGPPGTMVPGEENWVVGKYGRILPVVNLKKHGTKNYSCCTICHLENMKPFHFHCRKYCCIKKVRKIDPSKYVHKVKKLERDGDEADADSHTIKPEELTWQMDLSDSEITRKRKGEFEDWKPKPKQRKAGLNYALEDVLKKSKHKYVFLEEDLDCYGEVEFEIVDSNKGAQTANRKCDTNTADLSKFESDSDYDSDKEISNKNLKYIAESLSGAPKPVVLLKEFTGTRMMKNITASIPLLNLTRKSKHVNSVDVNENKATDITKVKSKGSDLVELKSKDNDMKIANAKQQTSERKQVNMGAFDTLNEFASGVSSVNYMPAVANDDNYDDSDRNMDQSDSSDEEISFKDKRLMSSNRESDRTSINKSFLVNNLDISNLNKTRQKCESGSMIGETKSKKKQVSLTENYSESESSDEDEGDGDDTVAVNSNVLMNNKINSCSSDTTEDEDDADDEAEEDDSEKGVENNNVPATREKALKNNSSDSKSSEESDDDDKKKTPAVKKKGNKDNSSSSDSSEESDDDDKKKTPALKTKVNPSSFDSSEESDDDDKKKTPALKTKVNPSSSDSSEESDDDDKKKTPALKTKVNPSSSDSSEESDDDDKKKTPALKTKVNPSSSDSSEESDDDDKKKTPVVKKKVNKDDSSSSDSSEESDDDNKKKIPVVKKQVNEDDPSESDSSESDDDDTPAVKNKVIKDNQSSSDSSDKSDADSSMDSDQDDMPSTFTPALNVHKHKGEQENLAAGKISIKEAEDLDETDEQTTGNKTKSEEGERHRLEAAAQKHQDKLKQTAAVQKALANINKGFSVNKKVVFNDGSDDDDDSSLLQVKTKADTNPLFHNLDEVEEEDDTLTEKIETEFVEEKKPTLFDSSSSDENDYSGDERSDSDDNRFAIRPLFEGSQGSKLLELQASYGNDKRFQLDKRFVDSDKEEEEEDVNKEGEVENEEKKNALKILESVVGFKVHEDPLENKKKKFGVTFKDVASLHYDPTLDEHKGFEMEKEKVSKKDKRRIEQEAERERKEQMDKDMTESNLKERFTEVSDSIIDAFSNKDASDGTQTFSLLQAFGAKAPEEEDMEQEGEAVSHDTDKLPLDERFTQNEGQEDGTVPMETSQAEPAKSLVEHVPRQERLLPPKRVARNRGKKMHTPFFFYLEEDRRLQASSHFCRTEDLDVIREKWKQEKQNHIERYKLKAKNFKRKLQKQPGQRDKFLKDKGNTKKIGRGDRYPRNKSKR